MHNTENIEDAIVQFAIQELMIYRYVDGEFLDINGFPVDEHILKVIIFNIAEMVIEDISFTSTQFRNIVTRVFDNIK